MSKLTEYHRKLDGFKSLDKVKPYENIGISDLCNMSKYTIRLETYNGFPDSEWFYKAICEHWPAIIKTMKKVGAIDVNKTKGEAAKEAGDFLGLVNSGE